MTNGPVVLPDRLVERGRQLGRRGELELAADGDARRARQLELDHEEARSSRRSPVTGRSADRNALTPCARASRRRR